MEKNEVEGKEGKGRVVYLERGVSHSPGHRRIKNASQWKN